MTVCLGALCLDQDGQRIIVASDRMVTYPGFIEFEHTVPKMTGSSMHSVTMFAGDALIGSHLVSETTRALAGTNPTVDQLRQQFAANYEAVRNQWVETQVLTTRGLNFQSFYQGHSSFNGQITAMIDQALAQYNLGLELLIAGIDVTGAHLHTVHNPGRTSRQHDVIGFAAIGSGWIHAMQSMIGFRHSPNAPFKETLYRAFASKKRAEVAPGVGTDTDMAVISGAGVQALSEVQMAELEEIHERIHSQTNDVLNTELSTLQFELQDPAVPPDPTPAPEERQDHEHIPTDHQADPPQSGGPD